MLSEKIIELLQYRINEEEKSARLYLAMSQWLSFNGYDGAGRLWYEYYKEELIHASWTYEYLHEKDVMPIANTVVGPMTDFEGIVDIVNKSFEHELTISNSCNELAIACHEEGDYMTNQLADKYLKEQAEEESKFLVFKDRIKAFGESPEALRLLDNEMAQKAAKL